MSLPLPIVTPAAVNNPAWVVTGLAVLMVVARVLARTRLSDQTSLGWDDYLVVVAMAVCLSGVSLLSASITAAARVTAENFLQTMPTANALNFAANTVFILNIPFSKFPVAVLLCHIFNSSRMTRYLLLGSCAFVLLLGITEYLVNWLACDPPAAQWNPWNHPDAKCLSPTVSVYYGLVFGSSTALHDVVFAVYPLCQLYKLKMSTRRKIWMSVVLGLGSVTVTFAVVQLWELYQLLHQAANPGNAFTVASRTALWDIIENCSIIICACVPPSFPLLQWIANRSTQITSSLKPLRSRHSSYALHSHTSSDQTDNAHGGEVIKMMRIVEQTYSKPV